MSEWHNATSHVYPSTWRVCAFCGATPMCADQGWAAIMPNAVDPPYGVNNPHLLKQCYTTMRNGEAGWNCCP